MNKAKIPPDFKPIFDYIDQAIMPLATKDDVSHLPSKSEFYKSMDRIAGELKTIRENQDSATFILRDYEDRLEKVESKLHVVAN